MPNLRNVVPFSICLALGACSDPSSLPALMRTDMGSADASNDGATVSDSATDAAVRDSGSMDAAMSDASMDSSLPDAAADGGIDAATDLGATDATVDLGSDASADMGFVVDCFLPTPYHDYPMTPWLVFLDAAEITSASGLTVVEREQIVTAAHQSAHTDVTTAEAAILAVDALTRERFWDDSNAKAVDVITYYSGDNRYGAVFDRGSSGMIAAIVDGDMSACTRPVGPLRNACASTSDCSATSTCVGIIDDIGKCVESDAVLGSGETCFTSDDCALDFGLVCTKNTSVESGMCLPAWMQTVVPVSVGDLGGGETFVVPIVMRGIATVDVAVSLGVYAPNHTRPTDLSVEVENPDTSISIAHITNPAQALGLIEFELPLFYSGDERVNGVWTLRITDSGTGGAEPIDRVWLRVRSRLD